MPGPVMQERISTLRQLRAAAAGQPAPTLAQTRASFDARSDQYPLPGDVLVTGADAGGVPARWLAAPGAGGGEVLLYLHGGGYQAAEATGLAGRFLREKIRH
jgi:monoterpene epsilon-lactone hydrolase